MPEPFAEKLTFVMKVLSISRSRLAATLGVDKSVVGRWGTGAAKPSAHSLSQLNALMAEQIDGFTGLDWDRDVDGLAELLGVESPKLRPTTARFGDGLSLPILEQSRITTRLRGGAYEGLFRSTRPYAQRPGFFIHDLLMIREDPNGLLRMSISTGGVTVDGWVLLLQNQLFCIGAELTSGGMVFAIINGVNTLQAGMVDGLILSCALDPGRTPTASTAVFERVGDLTDYPGADNLRFEELAGGDFVSPAESVPEALRDHLSRDIGPSQLAVGGDWLLRLPLARSMSRGLT